MKNNFFKYLSIPLLLGVLAAPALGDELLNVYQVSYKDAAGNASRLTISAAPCWKISGDGIREVGRKIVYKNSAGQRSSLLVRADAAWTIESPDVDAVQQAHIDL